MTSPDDTAPHGGATHTLGKHTLVDVGELAVRAADHAIEARDTVQRLEGIVLRHDAQLVEVLSLSKLALAPIKPSWPIRVAAVAGAFALCIIALAAVTLVSRTSSADAGSARAQATAQK